MGILADDFTPLKEPVTYFSKYGTHTHTVRTSSEIIIDGKIVKRPSLKIVFTNHKCVTRDPRIVEAMDNEILIYKKWSNIMYKAPTREEQERAKKVAKKLADARRKILEEMGSEVPKPEVGKRPDKKEGEFKKFLEKEEQSIKSAKERLVTGRRSVGDAGGKRIQQP